MGRHRSAKLAADTNRAFVMVLRSEKTAGVTGLAIGGRGGVDRAPWLAPPPPKKKAQLTGPPKTTLGTFGVEMAVVLRALGPRSIPATHVCSAESESE